MERIRVLVALGTRPEAIKLAPVIKNLKRHSEEFETIVLATAQHRQMLDQVFELFGLKPDIDLNIMSPNQGLTELTSTLLSNIGPVLRDLQPDLLMVQGDTTTVLGASLAAFNERIPIAHVEAGLRSGNLFSPFPEEANRKLTGSMASIHFAPTPLAASNLMREGVSAQQIVVTGNTAVDALAEILDIPFDMDTSPLAGIPFEGHRVLALTSHRRETWGRELQDICQAITTLLENMPDLIVVYPVHLNPNVRQTVMTYLGGHDRIFLTEPLDYLTFINLLRRSDLILTDSGGVQEEAPSLHKPLLVLRKLTERPEAFNCGLARVVGTRKDDIVQAVTQVLTDPHIYRTMSSGPNPYGDGKASQRIVNTLLNWNAAISPLLSPEQTFSLKPPTATMAVTTAMGLRLQA
jgi:UDP-N-acetylglucosamine 2-epimerase (non-hydrolysing)